MKIRLFLALAFVANLAASAHAVTPVCGFEQDADVAAWKYESKDGTKLERSAEFATAGQSALRFTTPTWKQGMGKWPAFETKPAVSDWSGYDRLVVDITNPNDECPTFSLFVSDSKVPFRKGLSYQFALPSPRVSAI